MDLDRYNRSFEEHVLILEEEADSRLRTFRRKCVRDYINRFTKQQDEWEITFRELLGKSQEEIPELRNVTFAEKPTIRLIDNQQAPIEVKPLEKSVEVLLQEKQQQQQAESRRELEAKAKNSVEVAAPTKQPVTSSKQSSGLAAGDTLEPLDPFPKEAEDYFTNNLALKEFIRIQEQQEQNRLLLEELTTSVRHKSFRNELVLFIKTQINSISNSDQSHLNTKTRLLTNFFMGQPMSFHERTICTAQHPQGQLFAMDMTAQTFVTVGTRLVNSVPAIAKCMAQVIIGIMKNNFPTFKDLVIGHLQERCPYLVPMYPRMADLPPTAAGLKLTSDALLRHKISCGYTTDFKTQTLESEEKYLARMQSMALIFSCLLVQLDNKSHAWSWLASFMSLKPETVITATILQAWQQGTSRTMYSTYRKQYKKLLEFMQSDFVKMIEKVTDKPNGRQPLVKLKNQLSEDYKSAF